MTPDRETDMSNVSHGRLLTLVVGLLLLAGAALAGATPAVAQPSNNPTCPLAEPRWETSQTSSGATVLVACGGSGGGDISGAGTHDGTLPQTSGPTTVPLAAAGALLGLGGGLFLTTRRRTVTFRVVDPA